MEGKLDSTVIIIAACTVVVLSYIFSIISLRFRIPSVLLLLATGIGLRYAEGYFNFHIDVPRSIVESIGTVGLIMIVLEAGLDLKLSRDKVPVIRNAFLSALLIFLVTAVLIAGFIYYRLQEPFLNSLVYAIPLSIMSSSIVLPSINHLNDEKKEFLIYEASLSDIIGIIFFNYIVAGEVFSFVSIGLFAGNLILSIILSLAVSLLLFYMLLRAKVNIRFFLVFALLILLYTIGKMLHLPSLIIILMFGLLINNWQLINLRWLNVFSKEEIEQTTQNLHSITAESSFLIRTFFFLLFGYSIDLQLLTDIDVIVSGTAIVAILILIRFIFLKLLLKSNILAELFFIPRGLITILLFYKIPENLKLESFNEGILFFVVLATGIIMMLGTLFIKGVEPQTEEI
ncbi:MAG: cation:proton antiporter [Chitinophagales bacterium]|nr:cation:proton antiporter [Chitinophagales bacterium]